MKNICFTCHGTVGQGGDRVGPNLTANPLPFPAFAAFVRTPSGYMPAYRSEFVNDRDVEDIYAFLLSVKRNPEPKDLPF